MVQMLGWFSAEAARSAAEAFEGSRVASQIFGKKLQGNRTVEPRVLCPCTTPHRATAEVFDNAVMRNGLVNHQGAQRDCTSHNSGTCCVPTAS